MNEEILRKIAQEEIKKQIMENLDSSIIFTYINNLEENLRNNYISKGKIKAKIEELEKSYNVGISDIYEAEKEFCIEKLKELLEE